MIEPYTAMAPIYDQMNRELDYAQWADFVEAQFSRFAAEKPSLVLDLAAGSGTMTAELAKRGYDMIAVDRSGEMLSLAADRMAEEGLTGVLLLQQDMTDFELYGTVDAVVCCLDSVNHLTGRGELSRCFSLVHNYLNPDGLFLFDVNTPYKFENIYANNHYIFEDNAADGASAYCGWQNEYDRESKLCNFYLSVFTEEEDGRFSRADEVQTERCYSKEELTENLANCGFEVVDFYGDFEFSTPKIDCERWYIVARAKK
jgi:SAM-dependent methyltransferase